MSRTWRVTLVTAAALSLSLGGAAFAQTDVDLKNDQNTPADVLVYGMGYSGQRYSQLDQINKDNAARLVPKWAYALTDNRGAEGMPLVKDGVIYATTHNATVAVDALTGRQIWKTAHDYPPAVLRIVCCGIVNRGAAIYQGMIIRGLLDMSLVALDAKTGKEIWKVKSPDGATAQNGYSYTAAPLVVDGVAIIGVAGAEYGIRGFIEGYDAKTGKHLWRLYTVPATGEKGYDTWAGDSAKVGGGSSWVTGTYDPENDLVYWGVGNPSPWNPRGRKGDNLYTNSIHAFRPKTGERVWYYQTSPNDPFDYDAVQTPVIGTIDVNGAPRKVVMQANRNGFLYVLDAKDGKLLAAHKFGRVNWADGVDMKTGKPIHTAAYKGALEGKKVEVWPSVTGVTNWQHMSFNPNTKLLYINTINVGMTYEAPEPKQLKPGQPSGPGSVKRTEVLENPNERGYLIAMEPMSGKIVWKTPYKSPNWSSTLSTAGGLVFTGVMTGEFQALDINTGKVLYSFQTPSGILGQPITWEKDGKQYLTVLSGIGGVYALRAGDPNLKNVPAGASLWTFGLMDAQ